MGSCAGCKYLIYHDTGYSNYTVEATDLICLRDQNPNLPTEVPYDWNEDPDKDNWPNTRGSRCSHYDRRVNGRAPRFDVDGEECLDQVTDDVETFQLVMDHFGSRSISETSPDRDSGIVVLDTGEVLAVYKRRLTVFTDRQAAETFLTIEKSNGG